mgnify:CR=1 FL=1
MPWRRRRRGGTRGGGEVGADVVGGIPHYELTREDGVESVRFAFALAEGKDLGSGKDFGKEMPEEGPESPAEGPTDPLPPPPPFTFVPEVLPNSP